MSASLEPLIEAIQAADETYAHLARLSWDGIAKPIGGLGDLETAICTVCAARRDRRATLAKKAVAVFCADNGVVAQGVSQTEARVTEIVARNLCRSATSVCKMASVARADVVPVDMGMLRRVDDPRMRTVHIADGTADCTLGPAMSHAQAIDAVLSGASIARGLADAGYDLLAAGEMGIGNTTTASALACALLDLPPADAVGPGAGLPPEGVAHKVEVVQRAIERNAPFDAGPVDALAKVGGFDIAGMAGFFLGCAAAMRPCLVDGFISSVAALVAVRIAPQVRSYLLPSHASSEPAARAVLGELGLTPIISAGMHLGEGTGAVAAMPLLDMARAVFLGMETFGENGIEPYVRYDRGDGR